VSVRCDCSMSLDWGNVPTWIGSILTSATVFAAYRTLRRTEKRHLREQASQVHVTMSRSLRAGTNRVFAVTMTATNRSGAPIYSVALGFATVPRVMIAERPFVDMGESVSEEVNFDEASDEIDVLTYTDAIVLFRDADGYWWERYARGTLTYPRLSELSDSDSRVERVLWRLVPRLMRRFPRRERLRSDIEIGADWTETV
jgi:hypothetical protein